MTDATKTKTPWHLWVVGIIGLLWNAFGAFDYTMTQTGGEAYLRALGMNDQQVAYYAAMPAWAMAVWAIGVWGAVAGAVLLLLRSKWALHVFVVSFAAFLLSLVYTYALSDSEGVVTSDAAYMSAVIAAACIFFIWYAWFATKRGLLR